MGTLNLRLRELVILAVGGYAWMNVSKDGNTKETGFYRFYADYERQVGLAAGQFICLLSVKSIEKNPNGALSCHGFSMKFRDGNGTFAITEGIHHEMYQVGVVNGFKYCRESDVPEHMRRFYEDCISKLDGEMVHCRHHKQEINHVPA